ncbi:28704_t:CDS:1, partial [Dentiscutata erythropus]
MAMKKTKLMSKKNDDDKDEKIKERKKLEKKLNNGFILRYNSINMDNKWRLPSNRYVEDVIYNWA